MYIHGTTRKNGMMENYQKVDSKEFGSKQFQIRAF